MCALLIALASVAFAGCGAGGGGKTDLILENWGEYLDPELLTKFNEENPDINLIQNTTTSNEEMYTVCSTEGSKIDMCVPSEYMVERMMKEGLLAKLDTTKLKNAKYIDKTAAASTADKNCDYSVPYMMGTLGIVYNKTMVSDKVDSWDILWNKKYDKKIMMYSSIRDSLAVALIKLGYDINTTDEKQLEEAGKLLIEQKPMVLAYGTDNIKDSMISGSCAIAVDYSGAASAAITENSDLDYVVPKEGSNVWVDCVVVMKNSEHKDAAMRFIDFLCDPKNAAKNAEYIGYTPANTEAVNLVDDKLKNNAGFKMNKEDIARCTYYKDLGDDLSKYNDVWMKVQTAG